MASKKRAAPTETRRAKHIKSTTQTSLNTSTKQVEIQDQVTFFEPSKIIPKWWERRKSSGTEEVTHKDIEYHVGDMVMVNVKRERGMREEQALIADFKPPYALLVWIFGTKITKERGALLMGKVGSGHTLILTAYVDISPVAALKRLMTPQERAQVCTDWVLHSDPIQAICISEPYDGCYMRYLVKKINGRYKPAKAPEIVSGPKTPVDTSITKMRKTLVSTVESSIKAGSKSAIPKVVQEEPTLEQKLEKRSKAILYLRHCLQKGFLTRDQTPKEEEMQQMAKYLAQLESYRDLEQSIIRDTKIDKLLKAITKLSSIPKEDTYNFTKRSINLLNAWSKSMSGDAKAVSVKANESTIEIKSGKAAAEEPKIKASKTVEIKGEDVSAESRCQSANSR